jgi:hypothetical protein
MRGWLLRRNAKITVVALVAVTGCTLLGTYDFDGYHPNTGEDASSDVREDADAAVSNDGGGSCTADLTSDPHNCGACGRDCVGGPCAAGACQPWTISTGQTACNSCGPSGLAVAGGFVFWTVYQPKGTVWRADLGDGGVAQMANDQAYAYPVAADSSFVYWGTADHLLRCAHAGCGGAPETIGAYNFVNGLALTDTFVYWTEGGYVRDAGPTGAVWIADKSVAPAPRSIASAQTWPQGVVVADALYWVNGGTAAKKYADGATMRVDLDGGLPSAIATAQQGPGSIVEHAGRLYWTNVGTPPGYKDGSVMTCVRDSCVPTVLAGQQAGAQGIAVDATGLYWTDEYGGAVMRCDPSASTGCRPTRVSNAQAPWAIALDDKSVFWTDVASGSVVRLAKPLP